MWIKPTPRKVQADPNFVHRNLHRDFNHNVERVVNWYENHFSINIETIRPEEKEFYEISSRSTLSRKGYKELWKAIDQALKDIDKGVAQSLKKKLFLQSLNKKGKFNKNKN